MRTAPGTSGPKTVSTAWSTDAEIGKTTTAGVCKVASAKVNFTGTVELPRLATQSAKPEFLKNWNGFVSGLEAEAAADLGYVYDNRGMIEKAIMAAPCDGTAEAMKAASEQLKAQVRSASAQRAAARAAAARAAAVQSGGQPATATAQPKRSREKSVSGLDKQTTRPTDD